MSFRNGVITVATISAFSIVSPALTVLISKTDVLPAETPVKAKAIEQTATPQNGIIECTATPVLPSPTIAPKTNKDAIIKAINSNVSGELAGKGETFYNAGNMYNVNPMLLAAICKHEAANGKSKAIKNLSNPSGIMADADSGKLKKFDDVDHGIVETARLIKSQYVDKGLKDIESIGKKYCPIGVNNDPTNLNKYWIPSVTKYYLEILKDTERGE